MKCYEISGPNGVDGLALVDKPVPKPGTGEVLVRLKAATLNYRDLLTVKGGYGSRQKFPLVPVSDGAGVIEAVGAGTREFAPGDRVIGSFFQSWFGGEPGEAKMSAALGGSVDGVLAEYRVFPARALVRTPEHLSDIEAAALPCAGLTAWSAVVKLGSVKPGQTRPGAGTGGVFFCLQLRKMCGARVDRDLVERCQDRSAQEAFGADLTLNYRNTPDWGEKARQWSRHGSTLSRKSAASAPSSSSRSGQPGLAVRSPLSGCWPDRRPSELRLPLMVMQQQRLQGVTVGSVEDLQAMVDAITLNRMKPVVDKTFSFDQAREASTYMASGAHFGKVAIAIG